MLSPILPAIIVLGAMLTLSLFGLFRANASAARARVASKSRS